MAVASTRIYLPVNPFKLRISPFSASSICCLSNSETYLGLPNTPPNTGTKISAINNDADNTAIKVNGKYFINSPIMPGQNISGAKAANVVAVEAIIGQAMRCAALL